MLKPFARRSRRHSPFALFLLLGLSLLCGGSPLLKVSAADIEEKKQLEHEDYDKWNKVGSQNISNDGKWISYSISPGKGDSTLKIREVSSTREYSVVRGSGLRFTQESNTAAYIVQPDPELIKQLKSEKKPSSEMPKSHLEILNLDTGKTTSISKVSRFTLPAEADGWIAFQLVAEDESDALKETKSPLSETYEITPEGIKRSAAPKQYREEPKEENTEAGAKEEASEEAKEEKKPKDGGKKSKKDKKAGSTLVLRSLQNHVEYRFPFVTSFRFNEQGTYLAFATSGNEADEDGVHVFDLNKLSRSQIASGLGNYGQPIFSKDGEHLSYLTNSDDYEAKDSKWSLYLWKTKQAQAKQIVAFDAKDLPPGWEIASSSAPLFSEDGKRLFFRTRPSPESEDEKDDEKEEVAKLDLWHWQDPSLQPQQLLRAERERNRTYYAVYDLKTRKTFQIADKDVPDVGIDSRNPSDYALGMADLEYRKMQSWDIQGFSDWYLIDLKSGERKLIAERHRGRPQLSPAGKFVYWWDGEQRKWFAISSQADDLSNAVDLGTGIEFRLDDELHDQPSLPGPNGSDGWLPSDEAILLRDRWDIWQVDPTGTKEPVCITNGLGRETKTRYEVERVDAESRSVDLSQRVVLSLLVHETKESGYAVLTPPKSDTDTSADENGESADTAFELTTLIKLNEKVSGLRKAKHSDDVMFSRSTFQKSPDIWSSTLEFKKTRRISKANPQQDDYTWGTAELVHWNAEDGQPLDGILYKPEGFDPSKKYPMLVYFYERSSEKLHNYSVPEAGRSIISFSFYVSRGYVLFIPDIPYSVGEPGPSAANAVLPGVKSIVDQGFIDEKRIGMQGHSWGGYQTAYLVTVSDMFACAESGAPVSNMTSAYGGIRWGSGMSRMFQYEKTQSRIGATLWDARDKYIANSPLFAADKINTPLLILHNDEDTAVPWYQGIELFVALRRLEKPAWMLNYNGDPHWVMGEANRIDFAKRMQQFFDHYLKGDPMPVWMAEGIPAVDKGKEFGFEYIPEKE